MSCNLDNLSQTQTNSLLDQLSLQMADSDLPQVKLNNLLIQASDAVLCNAECQFQRESELLYQEYLNAQLNLEEAPHEFFEAQKNYMVYTDGEPAYNRFIDAELLAQAEVIVNEYNANFAEGSQQVAVMIGTYESILVNFKNVFDLYVKYVEENARLLKDIKKDQNDITTNNRKAYYEDESLNTVKNRYYYILIGIYILCILVFIICFFIKPTDLNYMGLFIVLVFLLGLPFLSYWIFKFVLFVCYQIYSIFPKNVYTQLNASEPSSS
jgi:hypothetical protein